MTPKQLRSSVLQLAVQGKLVEQDPNDEPAEILLRKIAEEKARLVASGAIKKSKDESVIFRGEDGKFYERVGEKTVCIDEELPFEIPDGWGWARLGTLCDIINGFTPLKSNPKFWTNGTIPWFTIDDVHDQGRRIRKTRKHININALSKNSNRILPANTVLICCTASVGEYAITEIPLTTNQQFNGLVIKEHLKNIYSEEFLLFIVQTFKQRLINVAGKTTFNFISVKKLGNFLIPVPPLNEQRRIVARLSELEPYISSYGTAYEGLESLRATFPARLKKSLLQWAIEGRLVPQDPGDEPAEALLERVAREKERLVASGAIKRDKNVGRIVRKDGGFFELRGGEWVCIDEELPFEVPEGWGWARLGEICNYGTCINAEARDIQDDAWILDLEDIEKDTGKILIKKKKYEVAFTSTKHSFKENDVLYSKLRPNLNKVVVADSDGYCTSEILPLTFSKEISPRYAQVYLMSPTFVQYAISCSYGVKMPRLGTTDGRNAWFAVPPLNEQRRIVARLEELFSAMKFQED